MKLVIFDDEQFDRFCPLAWLRGVFELKCGATTLRHKIERAVGFDADALLVRDYLAPTVARRNVPAAVNDLSACRGAEVLFVNGRVRGSKWTPPAERVGQWRGQQLAVWRTDRDVSQVRSYADLAAAAGQSDRTDYAGAWFDYIWDVMLSNPEEIESDFELAGNSGVRGDLHESSVIFGPPERVYIAPEARIHPFVCIDTNEGPVTIEAGCEIHPYTRIEGPCCVGPKTILFGAKLREGCSIGPMCRIGGEVEESIVHGYSNKYHDGFLGHAYVGEWVNLGAQTSNSDLKNDYSNVSLTVAGVPIDTGSPKVGSFIGDHVKTSIGTLLNTGTTVGTMAVLVATGGPLPKTIPPFAWFLNGVVSKGYGLNKLIAVARTAMGRRQVTMTDADEALLRRVFELTAEDRQAEVRKGRRKLVRGA